MSAGEVFCVVSVGARERTRGCSPRALGWFGQNRLGDFLSCRRVRASAPAGVAPELPGGSGRTVWGVFGSGRVCTCLVGTEFLTKASLCSRGVFKHGD